MNAFEVLGLSNNATQEQVHEAYRSLVKRCHPDQFQEKEQQDRAQEQLIRLNLAYEEALRITARRQIGFHPVPTAEAIAAARKLLEQQRAEGALRQLMRADQKNAEWYFWQGEILMQMRQYSSAHQSYREAVRLDPDSLPYRRAAFEAARTVRQHNRPLQRMADTFSRIFRKK